MDGIDHEVFRAWDGEALPDVEDFDAFILTGDYAYISDGLVPYHLAQMDLVRSVGKKKVFGSCFGHQLIAEVFGGKTQRREERFFGWRKLTIEEDHPIFEGLTEPSALAATDDGRILIAERTTGNVRQVRLGLLQSDPLCSVAVATGDEAGLLGMAFEPDQDYLFLYYTSSTSSTNKVTRVTIQGNACVNPVDVLADLGAGGSFLRNGGGIAIGPDGKLYVATGDMEDDSNAQADVLQGKVLRVNLDGTIPDDNPVSGSAIFARGIRDGRGLTINPAGQVYVTDRGDDLDSVHDETNVAASDGNLGWSFQWQKPVNEVLADRLPTTLAISMSSLIVVWIVAIPIAILSATNQYTWFDYTFTFIGFIGLSMPQFLLALVASWVIYDLTGWAITGLFSKEFADAAWSFAKFLDLMKNIWLPIIICCMPTMCRLKAVGTADSAARVNVIIPTIMTTR